MGDDYEPEDFDSLNLPISSQSGNADIGQASTLTTRETQEQAGILNDILNNYYTEHENYVSLLNDLREAGYSEDQVHEISNSAQEERIYRIGHHDEPSELTPNQLQFLRNQGSQFDISRTTIYTDDDGRLYADDFRVRDVEGRPSRLYLPEGIAFNPLTQTQQQEADRRQEILDDIYITEYQDTGEHRTYTEDQRAEISRITYNYLNSPPENRAEARELFRHNIQEINNLGNVDNIQDNLYDYFVDVDNEYDFRRENGGLPQLLSQEQLDFIRQGNNGNYRGQPIYADTDLDILYFYNGNEKIVVPSGEDLDFDAEPDEIEYSSTMNTLPPNDLYVINLLTTNYFNHPEERDNFYNNIINQLTDPTDPFAPSIENDVRDYVITIELENEYRELNNGKPSQLSELQYEYLMNHTLSENENRYNNELIYVREDGLLYYIDENDSQTLGDIDAIASGEVSRTRLNEQILLPTNEIIESYVEEGSYIREGDRNPELEHPQPSIPSVEPIDPIEIERPPLDLVNEDDDVEDLLDRLEEISGVDEISEDIVMPDETVSEGMVQLTNEEREYHRYYDRNQYLYAGFRETFTSILPPLFSITGGFIGYSFGVMKKRMFLRGVETENLRMLDDLDHQIQNLLDRKNNQLLINTETLEQINEQETELLFEGAEAGGIGYETLEELNIQRGLLAGTEDDPDLDAEDLRDLIYGSGGLSSRLRDVNIDVRSIKRELNELQEIRDEIQETREQLEDLDNLIVDQTSNREQINNQFTIIMNNNYRILYSVYEYNKEIFTGATTGFAIGTSLSLVLGGYMYPTYITDENDELVSENIKLEKKDKNANEDKNKQKKQEKPIDKQQLLEIPERPQLVITNQNKFYEITPSPYEKISTNNKTIIQPTFIPVKDNNNKPLSFKEVNELKSTLSKSELNNLKNKYLIFDDNNQVQQIKTEDKCKNYVGQVQINRIPIK